MIERQHRAIIDGREVGVFGIGTTPRPARDVRLSISDHHRASVEMDNGKRVDWSAVRASWAAGKFPKRGISGWHLE
jgi:hypothetical protein